MFLSFFFCYKSPLSFQCIILDVFSETKVRDFFNEVMTKNRSIETIALVMFHGTLTSRSGEEPTFLEKWYSDIFVAFSKWHYKNMSSSSIAPSMVQDHRKKNLLVNFLFWKNLPPDIDFCVWVSKFSSFISEKYVFSIHYTVYSTYIGGWALGWVNFSEFEITVCGKLSKQNWTDHF